MTEKQLIEWNEYFVYDESSPSCLRWKNHVYSGLNHAVLRIKAGTPAGSLHTSEKGKQYWKVLLNYKSYMVHRIIWEMFNGKIEGRLKIDHYNTDSTDNKISNLRKVPQKINTRNGKKRKTNKSGVTGVYSRVFDTSGKFWIATWQEQDGRNPSKAFSVTRYGEDEAFRLAVEYRIKMIERLNCEGAGYTEHHGL